jgi:uncharacterized protein (TIGR02099 family)
MSSFLMPDHGPTKAPLPGGDAAPAGRFASLRARVIGARPALVRICLWGAVAAYFGFAALFLGLRHVVVPQVDNYRDGIAQLLSRSLGLKVTIGGIDAQWRGLRPRLSLHQLQLYDQEGRLALAFDNVDTEIAWHTLIARKLRLHRLELNAPVITMRREPDGRIFVAGIPLNAGARDDDISDWVLAQGNLVIRDATLRWEDAQRGAPPLELRDVNFRLESFGSRHRFGLTADPPPQMASRLDVRGDFRGEDLDRIEQWRGEAYVSLDYADLAVWRTWVDYPVELPRGSGGLRLWLNVDKGRLSGGTADLAVHDLGVRLAPELPMLGVLQLNGRLTARLPGAGFEISGKALALEAREGVRIEPTDFLARYAPGQEGRPARGELTANRLDLAAVQALAAHLPLDEAVRKRLAEFAPQGRLNDLKLTWNSKGSGAEMVLTGYSLRTRFDDLGMRPVGLIPGFSGLSGNIDASDKAGAASLVGRNARLELPRVFPEPQMGFDELSAQFSWTLDHEVLEAQVQQLAFSNKDATGTAGGRYRAKQGERGEIDVTARLTRAEGGEVWRYMPHVVTAEVREWLRQGIRGGSSDDVRLRLKGDLKQFPFADGKSGVFRVSGKISKAGLHYAPDWPELSDVSGDLLFEGKRMLIRAERGKILGFAISGASAEVPDLFVHDEILHVKGKASGETAEFLRFIEASPVSERIEHFTRWMKAEGGGNGQIQIVLPLRRIPDATVQGEYGFLDNRVIVEPGLPPLTEVRGKLEYTHQAVSVHKLTASMLGAPLTLTADTRPDGGVAISLQGGATIAGLRQHYEHHESALFEHLSGSTTWSGSLLVRKRNAEVSLQSNLQGIASSLPEPFNKTAADQLPLRIERLPAGDEGPGREGESRELVRITLGKVLNAQLLRRHQGAMSSIERGVIGIPEAPALPERGLLVTVNMPALDIDRWRRIMGAGAGTGATALAAVNLKSNQVSAFGRRFHDIDLRATRQDDTWQAQVSGRELTGTIAWRSQERGRLHARLKRFSLVDAKAAEDPAAEEPLRELPAVDAVVEDFILHGRSLGRLELTAVNRDDAWQIEKLAIENPDAKLKGDGTWKHTPNMQETRLNFSLESSNVGRLLERLGYADALRRGAADLEGKVTWNGPPTSLHYPTLSGTLSLHASAGQFNKLEPGVGRLLGIMSLQALPRRISLDFRDVFSEGFAFDKIAGDMKLNRGMMATENLQIQGPSAKILMKGETNLAEETQNLRVYVQPTLSETVAVGAAVVNPVIGLATLVAQKVLRDPIEKMFSYEYAVTGSWVDPKVEKIAARSEGQEQ